MRLGSLLALTLGIFSVAAQAKEPCEFVYFTERPNWVNDALFDSSGNLLLIDPLSDQVRKYGLQGQADTISANLRIESPSRFTKANGALFFETELGKFLSVTEKGGLQGAPLELKSQALQSKGDMIGRQVEKLWQWVIATKPGSAVGGGDIVGFGDIYQGRGSRGLAANWDFDFVRIPLANPSTFRVLRGASPNGINHEQIDSSNPIRTAARLDYPILAALGADVYLLRLEDPPVLYLNRPGTSLLEPVEIVSSKPPLEAIGVKLPGLSSIPDLGFAQFGRNYPTMMRKMTRETTYGGLFADGDQLIYLSRSPQDPNASDSVATHWTLTRLVPEPPQGSGKGDHSPPRLKITGQSKLDGFAFPHLTLTIGPRYWAFIARGLPSENLEAKNWEIVQEIPGMYLVPAETAANALTKSLPICQSRPSKTMK